MEPNDRNRKEEETPTYKSSLLKNCPVVSSAEYYSCLQTFFSHQVHAERGINLCNMAHHFDFLYIQIMYFQVGRLGGQYWLLVPHCWKWDLYAYLWKSGPWGMWSFVSLFSWSSRMPFPSQACGSLELWPWTYRELLTIPLIHWFTGARGTNCA